MAGIVKASFSSQQSAHVLKARCCCQSMVCCWKNEWKSPDLRARPTAAGLRSQNHRVTRAFSPEYNVERVLRYFETGYLAV